MAAPSDLPPPAAPAASDQAHAGRQLATVAAIVAVDPIGVGGVVLRGSASAVRDHWLHCLCSAWPGDTPVRRLPLHTDDAQLCGGLDWAASLHQGRLVMQPGLLAQLDGGLAIIVSAQRLATLVASRLARILDTGEARIERHGQSLAYSARMACIALDEGCDDGERVPAMLRDRLAFELQVDASMADIGLGSKTDPQTVVRARRLLPQVGISDALLQALCAAGIALGVPGMRASLQALRTARVLAALDGRTAVEPSDCALAASLVLAPRATRIPASETTEGQHAPQPAEPDPPADVQTQDGDSQAEDDGSAPGQPPAGQDSAQGQAQRPESRDGQDRLDDVVLQAARAAIPAGLLATLGIEAACGRRASSRQGSGARRDNAARGRPAGVRRGLPGAGGRLNILATLRAAAPWQKLRQATPAHHRGEPVDGRGAPKLRIHVQRSDLHVNRYRQRRETTAIFAVDASGSSALQRLAEAKGAVELLLSECYVRRDRVAVLAFRGRSAEVLLPPTRSLVRARRSLAGLPGGGGTPLAAGIDGICELASASAARGETPVIVLLTDGRANIARDGSPGRERAMADAMAATARVRDQGWACVLIDTSPQPQPGAQQLAVAMGGVYLPLPYAGAVAMSQAVSSLMAVAPTGR
jgi:magnesium chelatase subunit D